MTSFYDTYAWQRLRYSVLRKYGFKCMACGARPAGGAEIHVDHIKPRHTHPELELVEANLQVLCRDCNMGKRAEFIDDHRPAQYRHRPIKRKRLSLKGRPKEWRRVKAASRLSQWIKNKMRDAESRNDTAAASQLLKQYIQLCRSIREESLAIVPADPWGAA